MGRRWVRRWGEEGPNLKFNAAQTNNAGLGILAKAAQITSGMVVPNRQVYLRDI